MDSYVVMMQDHSSVLIMWGALLLQWFLPLTSAYHPIGIWQQLAHAIAVRVNQPHYPRQQRLLSGTLAWLLMWMTMLVFLIAARELMWMPNVFQLVLLYLALDWRNTYTFNQRFIKAYQADDKAYCRQLLETPLNRNTLSLSMLGLGKAAAETQLLAYARLVVGVLFWYSIGGGIAALMYRLAISMARQWSPSRASLRHFGEPAVRILALLDIIPLRLFALLICLGRNARGALLGIRQQGEQWLLPGPGWLLTATGHKLSLSLGGPVIYKDIKVQRPRIGGRVAPAAIHLMQVERLIQSRLLIWIALQSLLLILFYGQF